jgi:hypothetical protein
LGIGRFDANLIIAAVQHRADGDALMAPEAAGKEPSRSISRWWPAAAVFLGVEISLSLFAWWALRG